MKTAVLKSAALPLVLTATLASCGNIQDTLPPIDLPIGIISVWMPDGLNDPNQVVYVPQTMPSSAIDLLRPVLTALPNPQLVGTAKIIGNTDATFDFYLRTDMTGCARMTGMLQWTCPAASEADARLGSVHVNTVSATYGPWAHARVRDALTGTMYLGLRVTAGQVTAGDVMNVDLSLRTK